MTAIGLVVMVCRNGVAYSRACLRTIQAQTLPISILVVDNASSDGTAAWLRSEAQQDKRITRLTYPDVRSVSTVWNEALKCAWCLGHSDALVVNNDLELLPETYALLRLVDGPGVVTGVSRGERESVVLPKSPLDPRPHPDFSNFLIRRWAWELVGPFDEAFVGAYCEDMDYHVRMHRLGIAAVCVDLPIYHPRSGTLRGADHAERSRIERNARANRERFRALYGCYPNSQKYVELFSGEVP